jgi:hypothetical protein
LAGSNRGLTDMSGKAVELMLTTATGGLTFRNGCPEARTGASFFFTFFLPRKWFAVGDTAGTDVSSGLMLSYLGSTILCLRSRFVVF